MVYARLVYEGNGPSGGTVRPVLGRRPWGAVDVQALPPYGWCRCCGGEVYEKGRQLCRRCGRMGDAQL